MASDLLLGWLIGIMTVIGPQVTLYVLKLRKQINFMVKQNGDKYPDTGESGTAYDKEFPNRKERS